MQRNYFIQLLLNQIPRFWTLSTAAWLDSRVLHNIPRQCQWMKSFRIWATASSSISDSSESSSTSPISVMMLGLLALVPAWFQCFTADDGSNWSTSRVSSKTVIRSDRCVSDSLLLQSDLTNFMWENPISASAEEAGRVRIRSMSPSTLGHCVPNDRLTSSHDSFFTVG